MNIVLDTDIGTDVDDAYALLLAMASPELCLRGVTVVHGDLEVRSLIAAKILALSNCANVPIVRGESAPMNRSRPVFWAGHEGRGIDFSDIECMTPRRENAPEFIAHLACEFPGELTLVTIGPLTNAGVLIRDHPREASMLRQIVSMASTFNGYGAEYAGKEHNASLDPEAMRLVVESGIPTLLVGLNVTLQTSLSRIHLAEIASAGTSLSSLMVNMTEDWLRVIGRDDTCMHDPLAVATAFDPSFVTTVPAKAEFLDDGTRVAYHEAEEDYPVRICTSVDADRFHEVFRARILQAVRTCLPVERQVQ